MDVKVEEKEEKNNKDVIRLAEIIEDGRRTGKEVKSDSGSGW